MKKLLFMFIILAVSLGIASPASAQSETLPMHNDINSPGSYCGFNEATISMDANWNIYAGGTVWADNSNPCSSENGSLLSLPANWLKVTISIRCLENGTEFEAVHKTAGNPTNSGYIETDYPYAQYCGYGTSIQARLVITSQYYIYPTGWTSFARTTHWMSPG